MGGVGGVRGGFFNRLKQALPSLTWLADFGSDILTFSSIPAASVGMEKLFLLLLTDLELLGWETEAAAGVSFPGVVTLRRILLRRRAFDTVEDGVLDADGGADGVAPVK